MHTTRQIAILACVIYFMLHCSGTRTQELLNANYLTDGQTAIKLISPPSNASTSQTPIFVWGEKTGISKYRIEISESSDFLNTVLDKEVTGANYNLDPADLKGTTQLNPVQYYWRVSAAKLANSLQSTASVINVLQTGVYYVNGSSSTSVQSGNRSTPYKLIQDAISAASAYRNSNPSSFATVRVAAGTYTENIVLKPGISLYGGYNATDWSRNVGTNTTTITAQLSIAVYVGSDIDSASTANTVMDGFTINGGSSASFQNFGVYFSGGSPTISNNTISGGSSTGNKTCGVAIYSGSNPVLTANSISGGSGTFAYGVQLVAATYTLANQTISSGSGTGGNAAYAVEVSGTSGTTTVSGNTININATTSPGYGISAVGTGAVTLTNNTINGGSATANQYGVLAGPTGGSLSISNNTITLSTASAQNYGIQSSGNFAVTVQGNTISAKGTNITYGIYTSSTTAWTISGNNIHGGTGSNPIGIALLSSSSTVVKNNIISGGNGGGPYGLFCSSCGAAKVVNNTINAGTLTSAGTAYAILINGSNTMSITNNIVYSTSSIGSRYGVVEFSAFSDPSMLQNNLFFDVPNGYYLDEGTTARIMENDLNNFSNTTQGGPSSGNMAMSVAANFAMVNFVSATDLHLTATTPLNIRCGGRDTSLAPESVTTDLDAVTRTASLAGTCAGASNSGAAGYSIGAYERD